MYKFHCMCLYASIPTLYVSFLTKQNNNDNNNNSKIVIERHPSRIYVRVNILALPGRIETLNCFDGF